VKEKTRFTVVAVASAVAASAITVLIDRFAMKQDLEFLGIVNTQVQDSVAELKKQIGEDESDDSE